MMNLQRLLVIAVAVTALTSVEDMLCAQTVASDEAARQQILQGERWHNATHALNEWLSIQQLYTPEEAATLRKEFRVRTAQMSAAELQDQLVDMEQKLAVLASPEAAEARRWLSQFLAVQAKYTDAQLRAMRPDIANMTASQIRQELTEFQARRGVARQTQAAAQTGRNLQVQSAQGVHAARQQSIEAARNRAAQASAAQVQRPQVSPRDLPGHSQPPYSPTPFYTIGPWGNPVRWDPLAGFW